ncbi:MAG: hypothetical protein GXO81_13310 [Chlorobi bacterium]|nr:hypothetical protein [Chlorobiota bacterium]
MSSSAELGWSETGSATTWDIELGAKGFTPAGVPTKTGVTNPYTYPGLSGNTQYDWYVRASCSGGGHSNWLGANTFTTAQAVAPVQNLPFSEDWENGLSDTKLNWYSGSVSTIQTSTASKHTGTYGLEQYGNGGSYTTPTGWAGAYTKAQPGGVNANSTSWIKMHVDLTNATNPWLTFWYAMGFIYVDFDNNLWVQVSTDGTTWTDLFKAKTNGADVAYMKKQLDLSTYKGKKIYIRFFHNGAVNSNYLYLDDISVANISCPDPSAQTVSTTTSSASLGWTENGSATTWDIELGAKGFTPAGVPTKTGVTSNPYTYPGLSTITSYDWYVRAVCGGGSYSSWVGPGTFSTKNNPVNPPYFQDFDNVTPPAFPGSMTVENTNGDAQTWHTTTSPHNSYPNSAEIDNNYTSPTVAKNDWFFTRGLNLTGGVTYEVNFVYLSGNGTEKLAVDWGADASSTAMSGTPVFDNANIRTNATWKIGSGTFTPSTTGAYYVGFHAYSDAGEDRIRVDDIQIVQYQQTATWTGTTDNDWTKGSNWSSGSPPGASADVIIPPGKSHYPTLTKTAYVKNLTIRSTATGDGALIGANHIMASGDETVQRYLTGGLWHYVSATTSGATVNSFYFNNNPDVWMDEFNEAHNSWTPVTSLTTAMPPGKGFEVWVKSGKSVTAAFTGTINSGNVLLTWSFTNAAHGYNLIGNPFSSAIDWHDIYQDIRQNSDDQVWEWNGSTYLDYVDGSKLGSLASGIIPIGQGFFVHATSAANVYINSNVQYSSSHKFYKSSGGDVLPHFVLLAEKGERKDEVWIAFHKGSTTAFENGFDGRKMIATQKGAAPQIYTKEGNNFLSIDCLPPVDDNSRTISLYFKANENGEQTIVAHDFDLVPGLNVVLEDTKLNVLQNLNNHPVYTFSADTAQDPARFLLHLTRSVNGIAKHTRMNVNTWANDHYLYISVSSDVSNVKKQLLVYDLLGRKMIEETLPSGELIKIPLPLSNSWVVVKIISPGKVYTNKVFVR